MSRVALVVGINQYPFLKDPTGKHQHLKTPAADAEAIARLLETDDNFQVNRLPASNIDGKLQVDPKKTVNVQELETAIADLFQPKSGRVPQTALLFFAGHGLRKPLGNLTQGFLATSDVSPSKSVWGMPLRDLWDILQGSQVQQQIIWLDCCFSGELLNFKETELGRQGAGCDHFFIAASRDYEVAYQQLDGEHGVLTGALLKGLDPSQIRESEWITNQALAVTIQQELQAYYVRTKISQSPLISYHGEPIRLLQGRGKLSENKQPPLLFQLLLNIDFKQQVNLVNKVIESQRVAAFLVHGERYHGQKLLVTRLLRLKPEWRNIPPIKIDVGQSIRGMTVPKLWGEMTSRFSLPKDAKADDIIDRICERLQDQDVFFIFYGVEDMLPGMLAKLIQEFWQPIVAQVGAYSCSTQGQRHLLMFLVDNSDRIYQSSSILLANHFKQPEFPRVPLLLRPLRPFPAKVLDEWISLAMTFDWEKIPAELNSQYLIENSGNGIPEWVCEEICDRFGCDWHGELTKWLI